MIPACFINPGDVTLMTVPGLSRRRHAHALLRRRRASPAAAARERLPARSRRHSRRREAARQAARPQLSRTARPASSRRATSTRRVVDFAQQAPGRGGAGRRAHRPHLRGRAAVASSRCRAPRTSAIEIHSLSKGFDMIGWRIGWFCGHPPHRAGARRREGQQRLRPVHRHPEGRDHGARRRDDPASARATSTAAGSRSWSRCCGAAASPARCPAAPTSSTARRRRAPATAGPFENAEAASQYLIHEHSIVTVPWDDAGPAPALLRHLRGGRRARGGCPHGRGRGTAPGDPPGLLRRARVRTAALLLGLLAALGARAGRRQRRGAGRAVRPAGHGEAGPPGRAPASRRRWWRSAIRAPTAPFDVACPAPGAGRWVDPRTWVYDFGARPARRHRLHVHAARAASRRSTARPVAARPFTFSTGGPAIVRTIPSAGGEIAEDQVLVLQLDGPSTPRRSRSTPAFTVQGLPERVPMRRADGRRARRDPAHARRLAARGAARRGRGAAALPERRARRAGLGSRHPRRRAASRRTRRRRCAGRRAPRSPPSCPASARTPPAAAPRFRPMRVHFSAPVRVVGREPRRPDRSGRQALDAGAADGRGLDRSRLTFRPPFPAATDFRIELPADLRDEAGRAPRERRQLPARGAHRRRAAAREVRRPLRHRRGEGRSDAARSRCATWSPRRPGAQLRVGGRVATHSRPPTRSLAAPGGVVTAHALGVRRRDHGRGRQPDQAARALASDRVAEVIGIPLGEPGLYVVELASTRLGAALLGTPGPLYVPTAALVTNLSVHLSGAGRRRSSG